MQSTIRSIAVHSSALAAALSVLVLAGCQKNGFDTVYAGGDSIIRFAPSIAGTEATTKGALINEDGTAGAFDPSKSFFVSAWDNAATPTNIIPGKAGSYQEVKMLGTQWNTVYTTGGKEYAKEYLWKSGEVKTFFAYAYLPSGDVVASIIPGAGEAPAQELRHTVPATASAQTDILLGFYSGDGTTGSPAKMTGTASIVFSHPLTAVKFKLGTIEGVESFAVNSISIEGVHSSGTAVMTPDSASESDSKDRVSWGSFGAATTVSQEVAGQTTAEAPVIGEAFLLIPQNFASSSTARIVINCTMDSKDIILYHPLAGTSWLAGKITTYHIAFVNGIMILTEAEVNEWNKQNRDIKVIK